MLPDKHGNLLANWGLLSEQAWGRGLEWWWQHQPGSEVPGRLGPRSLPPALAAAWVTRRQDHQPPLEMAGVPGGGWRAMTGEACLAAQTSGRPGGAHIL